jgi:hypothetical protein
MNDAEGEGLFFPLQELIVLYGHLQSSAHDLPAPGRMILAKIESKLYQHLSIEEMEDLNNPCRGAAPK